MHGRQVRGTTYHTWAACVLDLQVLPMLLLVPRLIQGPPGSGRGMSMLGYGDVVVPGLLIMLLRRFEVAVGRGSGAASYTLWAVCAYVVGVLLTNAALLYDFGGSQGQPALLYLVPTTLGATAALAAARGDLRALWRGEVVDVKDHVSGEEDDAPDRSQRGVLLGDSMDLGAAQEHMHGGPSPPRQASLPPLGTRDFYTAKFRSAAVALAGWCSGAGCSIACERGCGLAVALRASTASHSLAA
jgi:signal peptide peptidase-like 2B